MTLHYLLLSPFSLDNSQEGKVLRVKEVGRILQAFRIKSQKPLLVVLVRFEKTKVILIRRTTY